MSIEDLAQGASTTQLIAALEAVLGMHGGTGTVQGQVYCYECRGKYDEDVRYPCPTMRSITKALA